ncbi:alpha/beta hydrolase [Zunongwangia endophytica]|uniref:Alpha/beta hydrolase n=1 Tax=Zunongwangia endophytica TaxID=1808945 RepID=A0ABV8H8U7_9FLAO|nr:alpha/beta hydrolase [Zunongwangia endophytica]MDN3595159.1 alpha/beta hydrolase [Zunongwangia endophytica]
MKKFSKIITSVVLLLAVFQMTAQDQVVKLYEGKAPGSEDWNWKEAQQYSKIFETEVVYNVTDPSLLVFKPENPNGTSIIIAPGGGFQTLSINREGIEVAKELASKGVTAFVLKYRLIHSKTDNPAKELINNLQDRDAHYKRSERVQKMAGNDCKAAIQYVRNNADKFGINTDKVGVIGFSAGATVILESVLNNHEAENLPNFAASLYGGPTDDLMNAEIPQNELPLFIAAASDDQLKLAPKSIALYNKWLQAEYQVELHMYAKGGHGFGMKTQNLPVDSWYKRFEDWLTQYKYLNK